MAEERGSPHVCGLPTSFQLKLTTKILRPRLRTRASRLIVQVLAMPLRWAGTSAVIEAASAPRPPPFLSDERDHYHTHQEDIRDIWMTRSKPDFVGLLFTSKPTTPAWFVASAGSPGPLSANGL